MPALELSVAGPSTIEDAGAITIEAGPRADQKSDWLDDRPEMEVVASEFDAAYYLADYPDVSKAGVDPLEHFFYTGWREGRNPNSQFDTGYYLEIHADARDSDVNPFLHFLSIGRAEGRLAHRPEVTSAGTDQPVPAKAIMQISSPSCSRSSMLPTIWCRSGCHRGRC